MVFIKKLICLILLLCLLLCGCGAGQTNKQLQRMLDFRTAVMASQQCRFLADVTADFSDRVYEFSLSCSYTPEGEAFLTVLEPESISGISAHVSEDGSDVEFDGTMISFGQLANGHVAPMSLPWLLGNAWTKGYISSAGTDGEHTVVTCLLGYGEKELTIETWFTDGNAPVRCEIYYDGRCCMAADLREFSL